MLITFSGVTLFPLSFRCLHLTISRYKSKNSSVASEVGEFFAFDYCGVLSSWSVPET